MRDSGIDNPSLLLVTSLPQRKSLLNALEKMPLAEVPLCTETISELKEEE